MIQVVMYVHAFLKGHTFSLASVIYNNIFLLVFSIILFGKVFQFVSLLQCLSPAGEYNLRLGIIKELHPDMVATYSGRLQLLAAFLNLQYFCWLLRYKSESWMVGLQLSAQVFEGHPFLVEAGVSVGGKDVKQVSSWCLLFLFAGNTCIIWSTFVFIMLSKYCAWNMKLSLLVVCSRIENFSWL